MGDSGMMDGSEALWDSGVRGRGGAFGLGCQMGGLKPRLPRMRCLAVGQGRLAGAPVCSQSTNHTRTEREKKRESRSCEKEPA